jgi:hypothetical protein
MAGARRRAGMLVSLAAFPSAPVSCLAFSTDRLGFSSKRAPLQDSSMLSHDAENQLAVQQVSTKCLASFLLFSRLMLYRFDVIIF